MGIDTPPRGETIGGRDGANLSRGCRGVALTLGEGAVRRIFLLSVLVAWTILPPVESRGSPVGGLPDDFIRYGANAQKGFDTCAAPSTSAMSTWWPSSPYWDIGIYIGGSSRACAQPNLTPAWATAAHGVDGVRWGFYLIWVGRQAPCSGFSSRISSNPTTAASQGVSEADGAITAAYNLGFTGRNIYFYDLEAFTAKGALSCSTTTARTAAKAFVNAWVDRIQNFYGHQAGMYGSSCGSYANDWAAIANPPGTVWLAQFNNDPDVWGLSCVPDTNWVAASQRLHQYRGGHNETWGGVTIKIDNDCERGFITPHGHPISADPACVNE